MKNNNIFIRLCKNSLLIAFVMTTLAGCPWEKDSGGVTPENATVQGTVTKGIIKGATVNVYGIEGGVLSSSALATTTTSDTGTYSITIPGTYTGPVLIEMRNNASYDATMTCDIWSCRGAYGSSYSYRNDMPMGNLILRTYVGNVAAGSVQSASVTPLTTMAAAYADNLAASGNGLDGGVIDTANSKVSNLFGINNIVITTAPDITGTASRTKNESKHAYLSAAILAIANQYPYYGDVENAIHAMVTDYVANGGELIYKESYYDYWYVISLADLAREAMSIASYSHHYGVESGAYTDLWLLNLIASDPSNIGQLTQTESSPTSGSSKLKVVKAFVSDVRTWGNIIYEETNWKAKYFQSQISAATMLYDASGPLLEEAFNHALKAAREAYISSGSVDLAGFFASRSIPASGTATVSGSSVRVVGKINGVDVDIELVFPDELNATSFTLVVNHSVVEKSKIRLEISSGEVTLNYGEEEIGRAHV